MCLSCHNSTEPPCSRPDLTCTIHCQRQDHRSPPKRESLAILRKYGSLKPQNKINPPSYNPWGSLILHDRYIPFLRTQGEQNVKLTFITLSGDLPASDWKGENHVSLDEMWGSPLNSKSQTYHINMLQPERTEGPGFLIQLAHQVHSLCRSNL